MRRVLVRFYDAVFADPMIGFMFAKADKARLVEKETELTARALGGELEYTGRPLRAAHARHTIFGGQFERRMQLLREAMDAHGVPPEVRAAWLAHNEALRAEVTAARGSECE